MVLLPSLLPAAADSLGHSDSLCLANMAAELEVLPQCSHSLRFTTIKGKFVTANWLKLCFFFTSLCSPILLALLVLVRLLLLLPLPVVVPVVPEEVLEAGEPLPGLALQAELLAGGLGLGVALVDVGLNVGVPMIFIFEISSSDRGFFRVLPVVAVDALLPGAPGVHLDEVPHLRVPVDQVDAAHGAEGAVGVVGVRVRLQVEN